MGITFACPGCGKGFTVPATVAGRRSRCKQCGREFTIPAVAEPSEPPQQPRRGAGAAAAPPLPAADEVTHEPSSATAATEWAPSQPGAADRKSRSPQLAFGAACLAVGMLLGIGLMLAIGRREPAAQALPRAIVQTAAPVDTAPPPAAVVASSPVPAAEVAPAPAPPPAPAARPQESPRPAASTPSIAELVARCEPSVALIKGRRGSGTGFLIRPKVLATNAHVIAGEAVTNFEIRFPSADVSKRGPLTGRLLYRDALRDLAFLAVDTDLPPLKVAESYVFRKGEDVTVIGNPGLGGEVVLENAISRGVVSSRTRLNGREFLQLGISINPGNSGGPVLDSAGRVIGVATLKSGQQEGLAFCVPVDDLTAALAIAESRNASAPAVASSDTTPSPAPTKATVPTAELSYGWKRGETYVYAVDLSLDTGAFVVALQGSSIYRVKAVDDEGVTLGHRGWLVARRRGADGRVVAGGISGPSGADREIELKIDRKGNVLNAVGASPLPLLGDLSMLVIEPLADDAQPAWEEAQTITLNEVQQVPGASGGSLRLGRPDLGGMARGRRTRAGSRIAGNARSRLSARAARAAPEPRTAAPAQVQVTMHAAQEQIDYSLGATEGDIVPIAKRYALSTEEIAGKEPRLKMTGEGTVRFDLKAGLPVSLDYHAQVVETAPNITIRVPITVSCRLLAGDERIRAMRRPVLPPTAENPIDADALARDLRDLGSDSKDRKRNACKLLFEAAPVAENRNEVARVLEALLSDAEPDLRADVVRALGVWGDEKSAGPLLDRLDDPSFGARDELFEALGRLDPGAAAAERLAAWLAKDPRRASLALRALGPAAERPLLALLQEPSSAPAGSEACRVLKEIGGAESVPVLESLRQLKDDGEAGRVADDAVRAIARRYPEGDEWAAILQDTTAPDAGRRRHAAERLLAIAPVEMRRDEVVRALVPLASDADRQTQSVAVRALALWAGPASRTLLLDVLANPAVHLTKELLDAVTRLGVADAKTAEVVAARFKHDRQLVGNALATLGPAAEKAVLAVVEKGDDRASRADLCKVLSKIGTEASLPLLNDLAAHEKDVFVKGSARQAVEEIAARKGGDRWIAAALADLKSNDRRRIKTAVDRLAAARPVPARRSEVARALEALLDDRDIFLRGALLRASAAWGDDRMADALAARLAKKDLRDWKETLQALVDLRADERTATVAVARLSDDPRFVTTLLRPIGPKAEPALAAALKSAQNGKTRIEACRALGEVGSPAVVPTLRALAGKAGQEQLARDAEEALKAIAARR